MQLSNLREGELKDLFDALEEAFTAVGTDYYLIGAVARDFWYSRGQKKFRGTKDVDFAVLVGSQREYEAIKQYLREHKQFNETRENAFVMITPTGIQVDILPFGEIEMDEGVKVEGNGLVNISVNGFKEVYQSGTEKLTAETGHRFAVATLPAIVLLKLIAFDDRPEKRLKDARDIANILMHYFELQSEFVYENHNDLFVGEEELSLEQIGATVIGRQLKVICSTNEGLYMRVQSILQGHIEKKEDSVFVVNMVAENGETVATNVDFLQRMHAALLSE